MAEKPLQAFAEDILSRLAFRTFSEPVLGASAAAEAEPGAGAAFACQRGFLPFAETLLKFAFGHAGELPGPEISEPVTVVHEMVAGINGAVLLGDQDAAAGFPHRAERRFPARKDPGGLREKLHVAFPQVVFDPFVENRDKEFAVACGIRRER